MIKEKELGEFLPTVRYPNGQGITLMSVQNALKDQADLIQIPIDFYADQIKHGGLVNGGKEDCIVIFHPDHKKDYLKICFSVSHQGNYAFVTTKVFGTSKQMGNHNSRDYRNFIANTLANPYGDTSTKINYLIGAGIGAGIRRVFKGKKDSVQLEEETNWYAIIGDMLNEILMIDGN